MTVEVASADAAAAFPAAAAAIMSSNGDDAPASDPAFDRLFGRDADGAPLWLRTEELLRIDNNDEGEGRKDAADDGGNEENENTNEEGRASGCKKSKDAFDAEAYIAEAKKLVRRED